MKVCYKVLFWYNLSITKYVCSWLFNNSLPIKLLPCYKESILGVRLRSFRFFGYVIEDRKIRNTCFFIFPRFHIWGVKTAFKVRVEKSFLWSISRTIRDRGQWTNFVSLNAKYDWLTRFSKSPFFPQKWFFNPNFERSFHPPNMKTGKNKKTRISYFSVLYNISKNQNDRRRTPKMLSLLV